MSKRHTPKEGDNMDKTTDPKKPARNKYNTAASNVRLSTGSFEKTLHRLSGVLISLPKKATAARENVSELRQMYQNLERKTNELAAWLDLQATLTPEANTTHAEEHPSDS